MQIPFQPFFWTDIWNWSWTSVQIFLSYKLSLKIFYLPFLCCGMNWMPPHPVPPNSVSGMTDHQVIRAAGIWNCVSSLMVQLLSAWPSTEQGICFSPCYVPRSPGPLPGWAEGRKRECLGYWLHGQDQQLAISPQRRFQVGAGSVG